MIDPSPPRRAVSWRSVSIGTVAVAIVCALTPYNDYVINNSFLTGSYIPPALMLAVLMMVGGNGLIHRFAPRRALAAGEMAVVTAMLLAACSVPGQGLMRNLVPLPVAFFYRGPNTEAVWKVFSTLGLPGWLFPVPDVATGRSSDVVTDFYGRTPAGGSIPWGAWVVPIFAWGSFVACLYTALVSLALLLRQQWVVNERLPFPLAQLGTMLIEPPAPGRAFNRLLSGGPFWIAAGGVFFLQGLVALHVYQPAYFPDLSFTFDLTKQLTEPPWQHLRYEVKHATLFFTFVGITYFIQSRVGFSLWFIFIVEQLVSMFIRTGGRDVPDGIWDDQHLGACAVFLLGTLWVGRHHWLTVARQAVTFRRPRAGEPRYAGRAWVFLAAVVGMYVWLVVVGCGPVMAAVVVAFILAAHVIVARVVAETGLPFIRMVATLPQVTSNFSPSMLDSRDVFFAGASTYFGPVASRESLLTHALHGLRIVGAAGEDEDRESKAEIHHGASASRSLPAHSRSSIPDARSLPHSSRAFVAAMAWALLVAFTVSIAASLWCYYSYALPLTKSPVTMENNWGAVDLPRQAIGNNLVDHAAGRYAPKPYEPLAQVGTGAAITGVLQFGALRYAAWPLMPVAYLVSHTWYVRIAWWSILVGWLAKILILRFGGASLYQNLKPVFVGLVVGEALATGFWLLVALALVWTGNNYEVVNFLPQ